ncbi:uncharacterized protein MAM_01441 [Metarhizium album ARSEF 1941]|uniref:Uncharacterized protein n=1 Tax=Metarhizium album (strain ARSEF 1941) TaxID=1081103 RepID=A0A0B2X4H9_METAS|nr:uncharacterized protein MAM_01441 [Metarhizium album ARSEF 1941]KHO00663.1 hypothetical protein MAM_01441 [Metarhizium album ARSEF 1941]
MVREGPFQHRQICSEVHIHEIHPSEIVERPYALGIKRRGEFEGWLGFAVGFAETLIAKVFDAQMEANLCTADSNCVWEMSFVAAAMLAMRIAGQKGVVEVADWGNRWRDSEKYAMMDTVVTVAAVAAAPVVIAGEAPVRIPKILALLVPLHACTPVPKLVE